MISIRDAISAWVAFQVRATIVGATDAVAHHRIGTPKGLMTSFGLNARGAQPARLIMRDRLENIPYYGNRISSTSV